MNAKKHIILIGFMGSGKTTLGKQLASKLKLPFVDSDEEIQANEGKTIAEIFEENGEAYFRALEGHFISSLAHRARAVISTGGGMPCQQDKLKELKKHGIVLYLQRPPKELLQRLLQAKAQRPLLRDKNNDELLAYIEQTLMERETYYSAADYVLTREQQEVKMVIEFLKNTNLL